jgi:hypothetical protein
MATGIVTTDNLTLRKTPDSNGSPMGLLPKGTAVDTIVDDRTCRRDPRRMGTG